MNCFPDNPSSLVLHYFKVISSLIDNVIGFEFFAGVKCHKELVDVRTVLVSTEYIIVKVA